MRAGLGEAAVAGVALVLCAAPLAALNVWPRLSQMWALGAASGNDVGIVLLVVVAALLMAAVPFAMEKAGNWGFWLVCLVFGVGLATLNYTLAVGSIGKVRDLNAGPARELVYKAGSLNSRIERARNSRNRLPQFAWTSAAGAAATKRAADAAATSREEECTKRGKAAGLCRDREADERAALTALATAESNRALTEQAEQLDGEIRRLEQELAVLGPIPESIDAQAARLAKVVGRFVDLGDNPVEAVADTVISAMSVFAELIGLLGPRIIVTAMARKDARPAPRRWPSLSWRRKPPMAPTAAAPAPETAAVAETPATPAPVRKPRKSKGSSVRELGSVREWKDSRTVARADGRVKPGDAYAAYRGWCAENGQEPVSLTAFGTTMKGALGVAYEERSKRGFYVGIALVGAPKLVSAA
jgi:hypothetical protein